MVRLSHTSHVRTDNPITTRRLFFSLIVAIVVGLLLRPSLANANTLLGTVTGSVKVVTADAPSHGPDTDGNYVNAPATRAQADLLILHGGHYVMGKGHFLFDDDALAVEAMNVAKHMTGKGWHRTFEDEGNGLTFIGAYNETTGAAIGIEVSGKWTLSVRPIFYGPNG